MPKNDPAEEIIDVSRLVTANGRVAEGLRLIKAFMQIDDPMLREALVDFAERLADPKARALGARAYS
jgi:hypothetical protein